MMSVEEVDRLIAETLEVPVPRVTPDLAYGGVAEWDSMNHVSLMLALEQRLGTVIDAETMVALSTVAAIRAYVEASQ
jgi:citrate synthase